MKETLGRRLGTITHFTEGRKCQVWTQHSPKLKLKFKVHWEILAARLSQATDAA